jgi:hypothetical protein
MEAWRLKMKPWSLKGIYRPVVVDSHHFKHELKPDLHYSEKLDPDPH